MLSNEQLEVIISKDGIDLADLILMEDHIAYIKNLNEEYGDSLDDDVYESLQNDLRKIVDKLRHYLDSKGIKVLDTKYMM